MDMEIVATSGVAATEVPEDVAIDLAEAYAALSKLPANRMVNTPNFPDEKAAKQFVRQGKAWATENGLQFARKGDIKGNPTRVSFRIWKPKAKAGE
jgi:hypothetical protein